MNVVVDGGVIRAVDRRVPDSWRKLPVIEADGATLLPGLIDAHTHTRSVSNLRDALRFGVTTVLDMWTPVDEPALRQAAARRTDVADIRSARFSVPASAILIRESEPKNRVEGCLRFARRCSSRAHCPERNRVAQRRYRRNMVLVGIS